MKIFEFDPTTGRKGKEIGWRKVNSWTGQSLDYQIKNNLIKPINFKIPKNWKDAQWQAHVDAGTSYINKNGLNDVSYRDDEKWICFCEGKWGTPLEGYKWQWVVLPPSKLIERIGE